jgi:hypothetical protein
MKSLRSALIALTVLVAVSLVHAAGDLEPAAKRRPLDAATAQTFKSRLNKSALRSLGAKITPGEQLRLLKLNPEYAGQTPVASDKSVRQVADQAWYNGITLTPLAPSFPLADVDRTLLRLNTRSAMLTSGMPLPVSSQSPPTLWLYHAADSDEPLLWLDVNWPAPGLYLITFVICDVVPDATACPRVWMPAANQMVNLTGNKPSGADKWTVLWNASPNTYRDGVVLLFAPSTMGAAFEYSCLSKVVISRLP